MSRQACWGGAIRSRHLWLRLLIAVVVLIIALFGTLQAYVKCEVYRAGSLLAEASGVQIGDTEASALAISKRYGGLGWTPESLPPKAQWIDKDEYEYQVRRLSDRQYELAISPFGSFAYRVGRLSDAIRIAREAVPAHWRTILGMRDWSTRVELSIREGRVQSVSAMTLVEGREGWVGHTWDLAENMPHHDMRPQAYAIGVAHLTTADGGGTIIRNFFTPGASEEEIDAARSFNHECLTSITGCGGLCDIAPRALQYLKQHPDAAWNIIPPQCN
jgi:hypothetical protein